MKIKCPNCGDDTGKETLYLVPKKFGKGQKDKWICSECGYEEIR